MSTTLVLGAARTSTSDYAAALVAAHPSVTYIATDPTAAATTGSDGTVPGRGHRPGTWDTVVTTELSRALLQSRTPVLIDTLSRWVWHVLDRENLWDSHRGAVAALEPLVDELLVVYRSLPHDVVAVSDEAGWGAEAEAATGREATYRHVLSYVNTRFSAVSQRVHLIVGGRVVDLSAAPSVLSATSVASLAH